MQVTDQSFRVLGGFPNKKKWIEARKHLIHVTKKDKFDPVVPNCTTALSMCFWGQET